MTLILIQLKEMELKTKKLYGMNLSPKMEENMEISFMLLILMMLNYPQP